MENEEYDNILSQIDQHIGNQEKFFEPGGKPREALPELDAAAELADQLPGKSKDFFNGLVDAFRENALGFAELQESTNYESIKQYFQAALDHRQHIQNEYPDAWQILEQNRGPILPDLDTQIRYVESLLTRPPDEVPDDAQARRRRFIEEALAKLTSEDPNRRMLEGLNDFNDALKPIQESASALDRMDLEDATRHIKIAADRLVKAEDAWNKGDTDHIRLLQSVGKGYRMLIDAQHSYISTLRDAVIGDVTNKHVAALTTADDELAEGLKQIETWGPRMKEFAPQLGVGFDIPQLRDAVIHQKEVLRNFRVLVREGTRARQVLLGATPKFLAYFVISFLVVLFGSMWSGLVPQINIPSVAGIALTVSVFSAYGFDAGRQVMSKFWPGNRYGSIENETD